MDKVEIRECVNLLKNDFSKYIPNNREFTSEVSPRTIYFDILCRLEEALNRIESEF